jgi:hypothetical protein
MNIFAQMFQFWHFRVGYWPHLSQLTEKVSLSSAMKRPLEEAAELFRENEALAGGDREKANLYRGLSLLAEGLRRLEKELAEVDSDLQDGPSHFYQRRRPGVRKEVRAGPAARTE